MEISGIQHASVTVSDMQRALEFYRDGLGLEVAHDFEGGGPQVARVVDVPGARFHVVQLRVPNEHCVVELLEYLEPREQAPYTLRNNHAGAHHLALLTPDIAQAVAELAARGATINAEPLLLEGGVFDGYWVTYVRDPDGNTIELMQPPSGGA
jgi:catechol 2,3-dioxygenase-like lactoylglutathione lyase family enzyme